ncbi:MAG: chalcone isomerase family protein [Bacteriovoracaceae bacterium]|nr:chalcone isomerase family protein [Bacteriovoracaceae bacterium]
MKNFAVLFVTLFLTLNLQAATKANITMPDTKNVSGRVLHLNGQGIRKATWLGIKVYVGGLYLEEKSTNHKAFLESEKSLKQVVMHFVRDVDGEKLVGGWNDGFKNSGNDKKELKDRLATFNSYMADVKKGQEIVLTFTPNQTEVTFNGQKKAAIKGGDFGKALLSVWFVGQDDKGLTKGMLGLEK